ncbi:hypothetical protein ASG43_14090 [Aureimonas sp. Leaf454]|nr:hypothetical protein ASG43_14090 [Aureimonas sp. Leaf454]
MVAGFRSNLDHFRPLGIVGDDSRIAMDGARSVAEFRMWLLAMATESTGLRNSHQCRPDRA